MSDNFDPRHYDPNRTEAYWADSQAEICHSTESQSPGSPRVEKCNAQLTALASLASVNIETSLVSDLSGSLHSLFDDVCEKTLPIYFGPLLGRLYLEGL